MQFSHSEGKNVNSDVDKQHAGQLRDPAKMPLFRTEAVEFATVPQHGSILLANDIGHRVLTWICLALAVAILCFFYFFTTSRKTSAQGIVVAREGLAKVFSMQPGVISAKRVSEGQQVNRGDTLFIVASEIDGSTPQSTQANIALLLRDRVRSVESEMVQSAKLFQLRAQTATKKRLDLELDLGRIERQIALQGERLALASESQTRFKQLQATSFVSAAQVQEKNADVIDQQQRLSELRGQKGAMLRDVAALESSVREIAFESQQNQQTLSRTALAVQQDLVESERHREFVVKAPCSGTVVTITAETGQTVAPNAALATIIPSQVQLEAELYVPSNAIGLIETGQTVLMRYQAYPYQKYGQHKATVRDIAVTALKPEELGLRFDSARGDPGEIYRVRLALERPYVMAHGVRRPLKVGMGLDASVVIDHRPLYQWILEPLFSITGRY